MSTRRARAVTADQWGKPDRNDAGEPICRWCRQPVLPPRRTFCGEACVHEWKVRSSPWYVRREVKKRDRGICRLCGLNVVKAHREWSRAKPLASDRAARRQWRAARPRWEADHILPVAEGGGECGLENYRLLCRACHVQVTLAWRARRKQLRTSNFAMPSRFHSLLAISLLFAGPAQQPTPRTPVVQSIDLQVPFAPVTFAQDNGVQLAYELHITNFLSVDVSLNAVQVNATGGRTLAEYKDADLKQRLIRPGLRHDHATPQIVGPGARAVVNFWLALPAGASHPASVTHVVDLEVLRPAGSVRTTVEGGTSAVSSQPAATLDAPLRGGPWVAIYDPLLKGGHRTAIYTVGGRARIPGRSAIDFIALPPGGVLVRDPASPPANWNGFGSDVLAVADGTIVAAVDDTPDETPTPVPLENASGNYVTIDIGGGRFAIYEHLQRGSVVVKTGQRVRRGEVIAKLGSSGSTSIGPHLHFHLADANSLLAAEGLPFVFNRFAHLGAYASIDALVNGQKPAFSTADRPVVLERPGPITIVRFGGAGNKPGLTEARR